MSLFFLKALKQKLKIPLQWKESANYLWPTKYLVLYLGIWGAKFLKSGGESSKYQGFLKEILLFVSKLEGNCTPVL